MKPTDSLMQEHRAIERMLNVLDSACDDLARGARVSPDVFANALEFFRVFADKCHHGKEEDMLFPLMESHDVPNTGGPIGAMLSDHDQGRAYVRAMSMALADYANPAARQRLVANARDYGALLRAHISKEDDVLFPMADMLLSESELNLLARRFDQIEAELIGPGEHARMERILEALEHQVMATA